MRAVVQRVSWARVVVDDQVVGAIDGGLLVLLGVGQGDDEADAEYLARKVVGLRVFEDERGQMNLALADVAGALLVVSQFTLYGDCRRGRRPSYVQAMEPAGAERLCRRFVAICGDLGAPVQTGRFRALMKVQSCNDGPVTVLLDSHKLF